jgi:hypothetical protein
MAIKTEDLKNIAYVGVGLIVLFIIWKMYKGVSEGIGSIGDIFGAGTEAKKTAKKIEDLDNLHLNDNPWKKEYAIYRLNKKGSNGYTFMSGAKVKSFLDGLDKYFGLFYDLTDDGSEITSRFKGAITHKMQLSQAANEYYNRTKGDFLEYIKSNMLGGLQQTNKHEQFNNIVSYISKLPE